MAKLTQNTLFAGSFNNCVLSCRENRGSRTTVISRADVKFLGVLALYLCFFPGYSQNWRLHVRQVFIPDGESRYIPVNLNKLIVCLSVTVDPSAGFHRDEVIEFTRSAITIFIPNNRRVVTKRLPFGAPFLIYIFVRNFSHSLSVFITAGTSTEIFLEWTCVNMRLFFHSETKERQRRNSIKSPRSRSGSDVIGRSPSTMSISSTDSFDSCSYPVSHARTASWTSPQRSSSQVCLVWFNIFCVDEWVKHSFNYQLEVDREG